MSTGDLIAAAQGGDKSAKIELWASLRKWVVVVCKRYIEFAKQSGNDLDDLINQSYIAFDKALYKYDIQSEYAFITFLTYYVRKEIRQYLNIRSGKEIIKTVSLDETIDEDNELTRLDLLEDESAPKAYESVESNASIERLLNYEGNRLSDRQLDVMLFIYRDGLSLKVIASRLGTSEGNVWQIKESALRKLRRSQGIQAYYEEFGYKHTFLGTFKKTHTSSVEWAVLKLERERYKIHRLKNTKGYFYYDL